MTYQYRGDQKRHSQTSGGVTTVYNWATGWVTVSEENTSGTLQRTYTSEAPAAQTSRVLANVDGTTPSTGAYRYYMHDHLGSTRSVYDQSKTSLGGCEYTPYGESYTATGPSDLTHRFTGHRWDATSALYYAPYRYYAPNLARWMTRDRPRQDVSV